MTVDSLPRGWSQASLGELVEIRDSERVPVNAKEREKRIGSVPYYGATGQVGWIDEPLFDEELLLLGEDGVQFFDASKPKAYIIRGPSWVNNHAHVLKARNDVTTHRYLMHYLNLFDYQGFAGGTTRLKLTQGAMRRIPVPLPPRDEQDRIVAAIEAHLSRIDAGVESLERARRNLDRMRGVILQQAAEGCITDLDSDVGAETSLLLDRAKEERALYARDKGSRLREAVECGHPPVELPSSWRWASLDEVSLLVTDGDHNPPKRVAEGVPHLSARHVRGWRLHQEGCTFVSPEGFEQTRARYEPLPGDLVVTCVGTLGEMAIVPEGLVFSTDRNLAGVRLAPGVLDPRFLQVVLSAPSWQRLLRRGSGSTAQPHLYLRDLRRVPVPVPPLRDQEKVLGEVQRLLSLLDVQVEVLERSVHRAEVLRRSVLAAAFSGALCCSCQGAVAPLDREDAGVTSGSLNE